MTLLSRRRVLMLCALLIVCSLFLWTFLGSGPLSFGVTTFIGLDGTTEVVVKGDRHLWTSPIHRHEDPSADTSSATAAYRASFDRVETLGIASSIYVLSLPRRVDRRASMERLRHTLGLRWTYIDAIDSEANTIRNIYVHLRKQLARMEFDVANGPADDTFEWPDASVVDALARSSSPLGFSDSDYWSLPSTLPDNGGTALLADTNADGITAPVVVAGYPGLLAASADPLPALAPLTCASENYLTGPPFELGLPAYMLLTPGKLACWHSHLEVIRRVADGRSMEDLVLGELDAHSQTDAVSVILEDDVDMERDIHDRLHEVWGSLPDDWDIVFLGHCWSNESYYPAIDNPEHGRSDTLHFRTALHPSFAPKCTHAYALTPTGARRLLLYLQHTPFAYSRALDQAISWLILSGKLKAFSVVPSLVVQRKVGRSDIDTSGGGMGSLWKDHLENGVLGS